MVPPDDDDSDDSVAVDPNDDVDDPETADVDRACPPPNVNKRPAVTLSN